MRCPAVLLLALAILVLPGLAFADCVHEGRTYAEGTRLGPYVCENGQWVPR